MDKKVKKKIDALIKMAKETGREGDPKDFTPIRSSLHETIKTQEQADRFMKMLKSL